MIRLSNSTQKLQALLGGAITTNQLPVVVNYSDHTSTAYSGGVTLINTNNTTAVDICAGPATPLTVRDVDTINVNNTDTVSATITIRYNDNGTTYTLFKAQLATGDQLTYVHGDGWKVLDSAGVIKSFSPTDLKLSSFAPTTSAELATVITDETGSGLLVFGTSPTLTTPNIGAATATSINGNTITAGTGTLTLGAGSTLVTSATNSITLTSTGATNVTLPTTGTLATLAGTETLSSKTLNLVSGAVGSPSLYLNGETTSGLYRIGANNHGWAISGAKVLDISSTGLAVTGTLSATGTLSGGTSGTGYSFSGSAAAGSLTLDASGNLGIGAGTITEKLTVNGRVQCQWDAYANGGTTSYTGDATSLVTGSSAGMWAARSDSALLFAISSTEKARIDSTGLAVTGTLSSTGVLSTTSDLKVSSSLPLLWMVDTTTSDTGFFTYVDAGTWNVASSTDAGSKVSDWMTITRSNGSLKLSGTGPHAIGGATDSQIQLYLTGTFAERNAFYVGSTLTVPANATAQGVNIAPTLNKAGSGTHADFASLSISAPTIGAGAATLTNASTLKITGAPTGATNNYALWCAGNTRWDSGYLKASSNTTYSGLSGSYHEFYQNNDSANEIVHFKAAGSTAANQRGIVITLTGDANDATAYFAKGFGNATERFTMRSNGGLANYSANDVNLSDASVKRDKGATADHTAFVKALAYRKFSYLDDQTDSDVDGLMAQDVQALDPTLVTEFSEGKLGIYTHRLQERINSIIPKLIQRIEALENQ